MINILSTFDLNFLQHAVVMIRSLVENHKEDDIQLYIYTDDKERVSAKLDAEFGQERIHFNFLDFDHTQFPRIRTKFHYGENYYKILYLRLNVGNILPDLDRVLLLDTDLVVDGNLKEFYGQELAEDEMFAAVAEVRPSSFDKFGVYPDYRKAKTNFNGGVMLIDLVKWRAWGASEKCMNHVIKNEQKLAAPSQDTLNPLYYNNWKICSPKYNLHHFYLQYPFVYEDLPYSKQEVNQAILNPIVIHFSGSMRPWHYLDLNPYSKKYWSYLKQTTYHQRKRENKSLKTFFLKPIRKAKALWSGARFLKVKP